MRYMLDTDMCSYIIRQHTPAVLVNLQDKVEAGADISISAISYAELRLGAERSKTPAKYNKSIELFCQRLNRVAPWDKAAANEFAMLQGKLLQKGKPIGNNDAMIAAHARDLNCILVTNNMKHFSRVPKLVVENWID